MCSFQTKSQKDFAITVAPEWTDCWPADDGGGKETVREHVALWDPAGLPVGHYQTMSRWCPSHGCAALTLTNGRTVRQLVS